MDGPVVSMAAHDELLMIVYHSGVGANGDQHLAYLLFDVDERFACVCVCVSVWKRELVCGLDTLPLALVSRCALT